MPRPKNAVPSYRLHKQSGQAIVTVTENGVRKDICLGRHGSPESKAEYERILHTIRTGGARSLVAAEGKGGSVAPADFTVAELMARFMEHAEAHYRRPDGTVTCEVHNYRLSFKPLVAMFAHVPAREFGPRALKSCRQWMVDRKWCRSQVNGRVNRIRRAFKWAASEELVPSAVYQSLTTVTGLQAGRSDAVEREPVAPVADAVVDATIPHLNRHVRGLVELQRLTGCRPGEACAIRRADIDTTGPVWLYRPTAHKLAYKNKTRVISIGPRAQQLLREFFTFNPDDYLFSPARATAEFHAARSARRKTPRYKSHMARNQTKRSANPVNQPDEKYTTLSYGQAVDRACDRAFPPVGSLARGEGESVDSWRERLTAEQRAELAVWRKARRWHPNQLRHLFATEVRKAHGLEAAQVLLGHSKADVTQVYAERNQALAAAVALKMG